MKTLLSQLIQAEPGIVRAASDDGSAASGFKNLAYGYAPDSAEAKICRFFAGTFTGEEITAECLQPELREVVRVLNEVDRTELFGGWTGSVRAGKK